MKSDAVAPMRAGTPLTRPRPVGERRLGVSLFVVAAAAFLLFQEGMVNNYDGQTMYEVTKAMVGEGTIAISGEWNTLPGRGGLDYGRYGLGLSLVSMVPYALSLPAADLIGHEDFVASAAVSSVTALVGAGLVVALYALARRMGAGVRAALIVAVGAVVGTFMLPYTKEFFSEPLATLCLVVAIERFLARKPGTAGLAMGAAILTRPQTLLFAPALLLVAWRRDGMRSALLGIAGLAPGVAATFAYNIARFGDPFSFGYQDVGFTTPFLAGARGLLFEPSKSLLLFAPIVVLLPLAFRHLLRRNAAAFWILAANLAITFVVTATWFAWHGGWSWGPRLLLPGILPALAAIGPWVSDLRRQRVAAVLFGLGFVVSFPALIVSPRAQTLEVPAPPPETHFLDTQPLYSPSVIRQFELIPAKLAYSVAHPYEDQPGSMNNLRTLSLWQFGTMRVLGTPGLYVSAAITGVLLFIGAAGYRRLRQAIQNAEQEPAHLDDTDDTDVTGTQYSGGTQLETMEVARNYNDFLASVVLSCADPSRPVLDFGAGRGTHARALRARGLDVRCIEVDSELRRRLQAEGFETATTVNGFEPQTFGCVYSLNVLEHIEDDEAALRDLFSATQPGGRLVVYVPAFPLLFSSMDRRVGHVRRYRKSRLTTLANDVGFVVESCRFVDSLGFLAALVYRVVSRSGALNARSVERYDRFVFPLSRRIDRVTGWWIGKNLLLEARRD
jgi:2-polyprenyl-3-methyl-5-hydroxy-6-metoxy-1,4-benzoquinol methylase